jgi:hypothetical protein
VPAVCSRALAAGWFELRVPDQGAIGKDQKRLTCRFTFDPVDEIVKLSFRKRRPARLRSIITDVSDGQGNKFGRQLHGGIDLYQVKEIE